MRPGVMEASPLPGEKAEETLAGGGVDVGAGVEVVVVSLLAAGTPSSGSSSAGGASNASATSVSSAQARPLSSSEVGAPIKRDEAEAEAEPVSEAAAEEANEFSREAPVSLESSRIIPKEAWPPWGGIACQYPGAWPEMACDEEPLFEEAETSAVFSRFQAWRTEE